MCVSEMTFTMYDKGVQSSDVSVSINGGSGDPAMIVEMHEEVEEVEEVDILLCYSF